MNEEVRKVLEMVENKIITPIEGVQLIQGIDEAYRASRLKFKGRLLCLEVKNDDKEQAEVRMQLPLQLIRSILKMDVIRNQIHLYLDEEVEIDFDPIIHWIEKENVDELMIVRSKDALITLRMV